MNPIHGVFAPLRSFFGLCATLSEIESEWEQVAGTALAHRSRVKSYDGGVLVVAVENRSVEQDMNFKKNSIIKAISAKTSLTLSDIRTEIAPVPCGMQRAARHAGKYSRRKRAVTVDASELEKLKAEILSKNPGLSEELAGTIAECRLESASVDNH